MSTENDTLALDGVETMLKRYDDGSIKLPNRAALRVLSHFAFTVMMTGTIAGGLMLAWSLACFFSLNNVDSITWLLLSFIPICGAIIGFRLLEWTTVTNDKYFRAVRQGEIYAVGFSTQNVPFFKIRGYTYAMEKRSYTVYPDTKLWEEYFLRFKTEGPFITEL